ncbi:Carboxy-terminal domain (CTD) phosphatase, partial [Kappamyces sp. JEL0680]
MGDQEITGITVNKSHYPIQIISWMVLAGSQAAKDQKLGIYEYLDSDSNLAHRAEIRSSVEGKIKSLKAIQSVCQDERYRPEATRIEKDNVDRLLRERKLSLLLDLDQTVIHATVDATVGEWLAHPDNPNFPVLKEVHSFTLPDSPIVYYIKLRPGALQFLEHIYDKYEMHIYTMGTRNYAHAVANILDPAKKYFQDRILSREDSGSFVHKTIKRLFPVDQSMVVAIDDRADVWQWSPNLIHVRAYDFFQGIGDINEPMKEGSVEPPRESPDTTQSVAVTNIPNPQNSREKPVMEDDDADLTFVKRIMTSLHANFYNRIDRTEPDADVCKILPWLKSQVLQGVHIVFSGVIPIGHDPKRNDLWIQATQFGATCHLELNSSITHLIARK